MTPISDSRTRTYPEALLLFIRRREMELWFFAVICICYWFSFMLMAPGGFSADSGIQFYQSKTGIFSNHHPPMMAWLWRILSRCFMLNKSSILAFHLLLFWACIYLLGLINMWFAQAWAYAGIALAIVPPVLTMIDAVWKDSGMALCCSLGSLIIFRHQYFSRPMRRPAALLVVTLFFYAVAVRHNAIFAMPPLVYWLVSVTCSPASGRNRKLLTAALVCIALLAGKMFFESAVTVKYIYPAQENMLKDLGAMSQVVNTPLLPPYVYSISGLDFEHFKKKEHVYLSGSYMSDKFGTSDPDKLAQLRQYYIDMVKAYPRQYLFYRGSMFKETLGLNHYTYWPTMWGTDSRSTLAAFIGKWLGHIGQGLWFKAYLWMSASMLLFVAASDGRFMPEALREPVFLLNLSSILYVLPYYLIAPSGGFRYYYWTMMAVLISLALLVPSLRFKKWRLRRDPEALA
jgi:hypothetical protein